MADIEHDLKRYLSDVKNGKWLRRTVNYVLEADGAERLRRLELICFQFERRTWQMLSPVLEREMSDEEFNELQRQSEASEMAKRMQEFYRTLAERLVSAKDVVTYLHVFRRMRDPQVIATMSENPPEDKESLRLSLIAGGLVRFQAAYISQVSVSSESAIRFALGVISVWEGSLRSFPIDLSEENAFGWKQDDRMGYALVFLMDTINREITEPPEVATWVTDLFKNEKAWIERLIDAIPGSQAAEEVLASILSIACFTLHQPWYEAFDDYDDSIEEARNAPWLNEMIQRLQQEGRLDNPNNLRDRAGTILQPRLRLRQPYYDRFQQWRTAYQEKMRASRESGERIITWFQANTAEIERQFDYRVKAVMERPLRTLRPNGLDHVEIEVSALRNAGIRAIAFYPDEYQFPDVGVHIIVHQETPTLVTYKTALRDFELKVHPEIVVRGEHAGEAETLAAILEFVVSDAYFRIVVAPTEIRDRHAWHCTGKEGQVQTRNVSVRGFPRRLRVGQKASKEAREAYLKTFGHDLSPGVTFVRGFMRDQVIQYALPTTAVVKYWDDDLLSAVEWS